MAYWLVKTEPGEYSFADLERDKTTRWDGVRNYQAQNNLKAMAVGDLVLVYHSVSEKALVGLAKVTQPAYPDPSEPKDTRWMVVDVAPVCRLKQPVTLAEIKANPSLQDLALIRQSRLSVMPITTVHFEQLLALSKTAIAL